MRGCPVRYRSGGDRVCAMHDDEDYRLTTRAAELGVMMAAIPGERNDGTGSSATDGGGQTVGRPGTA